MFRMIPPRLNTMAWPRPDFTQWHGHALPEQDVLLLRIPVCKKHTYRPRLNRPSTEMMKTSTFIG
jgi:hypothetical protein